MFICCFLDKDKINTPLSFHKNKGMCSLSTLKRNVYDKIDRNGYLLLIILLLTKFSNRKLNRIFFKNPILHFHFFSPLPNKPLEEL